MESLTAGKLESWLVGVFPVELSICRISDHITCLNLRDGTGLSPACPFGRCDSSAPCHVSDC